jgi:hypothetical protein
LPGGIDKETIMFAPKFSHTASLAFAVFCLSTLAAVSVAEAKTIVSFKGTRSQVAAACSNLGLEAADYNYGGGTVGYTGCVNEAAGTSVTCNDNGDCWGEVPRMVGQLDLRGILAGSFATMAPASPPPSLSGGGQSDSAAVYTDGPVIK